MTVLSHGRRESGAVTTGPNPYARARGGHHRPLRVRISDELHALGAALVLVWGAVAVLAMVMAAAAGLCAAHDQVPSAVAFGAGSLAGCIAFSLFVRYRP